MLKNPKRSRLGGVPGVTGAEIVPRKPRRSLHREKYFRIKFAARACRCSLLQVLRQLTPRVTVNIGSNTQPWLGPQWPEKADESGPMQKLGGALVTLI